MPSTRPYVGVNLDYSYEVFRSGVRPTDRTHPQYLYVIGPFRTAEGATLMAEKGRGNPHLRCVADAERMVKKGHAAKSPQPKKTAKPKEQVDILFDPDTGETWLEKAEETAE